MGDSPPCLGMTPRASWHPPPRVQGAVWTPRGPQGLCPEGEGPLEQRLPSGMLSDTSNNPLPSCPKATVSYTSPTPLELWELCPPLGCHSPLLLSPSCVRRVSGFLSPRAGPPPTVVMHPSALHYAPGHSLGGVCVAVPRGPCPGVPAAPPASPGSWPRRLRPPPSCCPNVGRRLSGEDREVDTVGTFLAAPEEAVHGLCEGCQHPTVKEPVGISSMSRS